MRRVIDGLVRHLLRFGWNLDNNVGNNLKVPFSLKLRSVPTNEVIILLFRCE